jgi:leader peptidase (prepilin peptidase) / N-methyltransferase
VLFLISKGFGFGDVKLALVLGAVLGWYSWAIVLVGTFVGYVLGALYGIGLILAGRAGRTTKWSAPEVLRGLTPEPVVGAAVQVSR